MLTSDNPIVSTCAIIVAAGNGSRSGLSEPKQYAMLAGKPILRWAVEAFHNHPQIDRVLVVVADGQQERVRSILQGLMIDICVGAETRQSSVFNGLKSVSHLKPKHVLIHDAARPLVSQTLIDNVLAGLETSLGSCPALAVVDSLRRGTDIIESTVSRDNVWRVQTPQGFDYQLLLEAHNNAPSGATDDAEIMRAAGHNVAIVTGDERAMKVTLPQDFAMIDRLLDKVTVTGMGFDVHKFGPGDHVWLNGVQIPHTNGLVGHSDADVGLHALTDAILGAIGAGDIGTHFPPSDEKWRGASSDRFLAHAAELVHEAGGRILHCDITLMCEAPKIGPQREKMLTRLGEILASHKPRLSVKATTTEGLGFTGRREGIAAQAIATVSLPTWEA